ncbi:hypothetical protein ACWGB8_19000 [Kitasatospora sp. NPDC054939]
MALANPRPSRCATAPPDDGAPTAAAPLWLVSMPTRSADRRGTQSFAVRGHTPAQAVAAAVARAGTDRALLRRRGAGVDVLAAHASLWTPLSGWA